MNSKNAITLMVGLAIGAYANNPKFKKSVDSGLQELIASAVTALNSGGGKNVSNATEEQSGNTDTVS